MKQWDEEMWIRCLCVFDVQGQVDTGLRGVVILGSCQSSFSVVVVPPRPLRSFMAANGIVMARPKRFSLVIDASALAIVSAFYGESFFAVDVMLQIGVRSHCVDARSELCFETPELDT